MWELDHKEGWALKNWCFWTTVLEKTLESSLESKEIKPVNPKGNQPWIFIGKTDTEAEAPIRWSPDREKPTCWKRPWCWERLKAEREEGDRGWDGWMESQIQGTWTWANSRRWWGTGKPGMLQSMGSRHDIVAEQQQQRLMHTTILLTYTCGFLMGSSQLTFKLKYLFYTTATIPVLSDIGWCHRHIFGYWYFSRNSWFQLVLHPARHFAWCTLHIS